MADLSQSIDMKGRVPDPERGLPLRIATLLVVGALVAGLSVFAGSRSTAPEVLGRYSLKLFSFLAVSTAATAALLLAVILWRAPFRGLLKRCFSRLSSTGALLESWAFGMPVLIGLFLWLGGRFTPLAREAGIAFALVLGYAGVLAALLSEGGLARARKAAVRGLLLLCSTLLTALLLEVALRIALPGSVFDPALDLRPHLRLTLHNSDLPGVDSTGAYSTNKWGMRGEEPPRDWDGWFTIVCVGGSTTQCFELDDSKAWPWLLQGDLRRAEPLTWVGNGGLAGHSTRAHIVFMREVISVVRPDMVVFLIGNNEKVNYNLGERPELAAIGLTTTTFGYRLFCASRLVQVLYSIKKAWIDEVPVQNTPWASRLRITPMDEPEMELPEDLHDLLMDPDFTRNNVRELIALAREYGVVPVFLTQPMLYEDTPYWRTILGQRSNSGAHPGSLSAATWWRLLATVNADVIDVCREEGVACYDLASVVPHAPEYFFDDIHFSEAGSGMVADSVAAFLLGSGLVPGAASDRP